MIGMYDNDPELVAETIFNLTMSQATDVCYILKKKGINLSISIIGSWNERDLAQDNKDNEDDYCDLKIDGYDRNDRANKINIIRVVRTHTGLGLKEAKELVENHDSLKGMRVPAAKKMKSSLENFKVQVKIILHDN